MLDEPKSNILTSVLGNQYSLLQMQGIRQGEGVIDVLNAYVGVFSDSGFGGCYSFSGSMLFAVIRSPALCKKITGTDGDLSILSASVVSCIVGTLIIMADERFIESVERIFRRPCWTSGCLLVSRAIAASVFTRHAVKSRHKSAETATTALRFLAG
jgi:hypothetical protein